MHRQQILGSGIILGTILVLSLVAAGVMQHRASAQGSGIGLLWTDVALLVVYGFAGMIVWKQRSPGAITAAVVGAQIGLVVGAMQIANRLIEVFVPTRPFVLIISPVLLALVLLGTAGAAAWEQTGSLVLAVVSGVCCAIVATLVTLCFAISFNLLFAARVDWQLREAFAASGMIDRAGFRVRNTLEASSEILIRIPLLAICLAFAGAVIHAWMSRESRRALVLAARFLAPFVFALGAAALWHANAIERAARHPLCYQESCLPELLCVLRIRFGRPSPVRRAGLGALGTPERLLSRVTRSPEVASISISAAAWPRPENDTWREQPLPLPRMGAAKRCIGPLLR